MKTTKTKTQKQSKNNKEEINKALELLLWCCNYEIKADIEDFGGESKEWHADEWEGAVKKAKANNLIVDEFKLDPKLKIKYEN